MFLMLAVVLAVLWGLGVLAFHAVGGLIHLLLIVAVISVVVHFVRGRGTTARV
jgi:Family of unknown function (DUF5670)